jgi:hypothetical protein
MKPLYGILFGLGMILGGCSSGGDSSGSAAAQTPTLTTQLVDVLSGFTFSYPTAENQTVEFVTCPVTAALLSAGCSCRYQTSAGQPAASSVFETDINVGAAFCACMFGPGGEPSTAKVSAVCAQPTTVRVVADATLHKPDALSLEPPPPNTQAIALKEELRLRATAHP